MNYPYHSGIYLLHISLSSTKKIKIGAKGINTFPEGDYYYAGSAQKNLNSRLQRHIQTEKSFHWHIDYFLAEARIKNCFTWPLSGEKECELASYFLHDLEGEVVMEGFGSSDCNCKTHLFLMPEDFIPIYNFQSDFPNIISG